MLTGQQIEAVEAMLTEQYSHCWRSLTTPEMKLGAHSTYCMGWRIELTDAVVRAPNVHYLLIVVDQAFPNSQPRVYAPEMGSDFLWPHVEPAGLLCLRPSVVDATGSERIALHLRDAISLLNLGDTECSAEFEREFGAYWAQRATEARDRLRVLSLVTPGGGSRQVSFRFDLKLGRITVADNRSALSSWLHNAGEQASSQQLLTAILVRLHRPWHPHEFPKTVAQAIEGLPDDLLRPALIQRPRALILFEALTPTGPVFAAVVAHTKKVDQVKKGYRSLSRVPTQSIKLALKQQPVDRVVVSRIDPAWIHGRGHSKELPNLQARTVAIIGCGAIGSEVALLLGKAGVGELLLIDHDDLQSANLGRHLLGVEHIGLNKAQSVASAIRQKLPHIKIQQIYQKKFERLTNDELQRLSVMDLIVTAGLDLEGEASFDTWRHALDFPPAYISTWSEAYGVAGHAVLLFGKDTLMSGFESERPIFRLTDWPTDAMHLIVEAGCGNSFQPHGATDLSPTISMCSRLVLDALLDQMPKSCRRVWFGDRDAVKNLGGNPLPSFTEEKAFREFPW